jgi:hypothetical protein
LVLQCHHFYSEAERGQEGLRIGSAGCMHRKWCTRIFCCQVHCLLQWTSISLRRPHGALPAARNTCLIIERKLNASREAHCLWHVQNRRLKQTGSAPLGLMPFSVALRDPRSNSVLKWADARRTDQACWHPGRPRLPRAGWMARIRTQARDEKSSAPISMADPYPRQARPPSHATG